MRALVLAAFVVAAPASAGPPGVAERADGALEIGVVGLSGSLQNPCWSPDGRRLAITQFRGAYNRGVAVVWLVERRGGVARAVSPGDGQSVNLPGSCWSRDDRVVCASDHGGVDEVWVSSAAGGAPRRVTAPPQVAFEPSFSPDGRWIAFESHVRGDRGEIWRVRADGRGLRRLTSGADDRQPNWSPRGDRIVFQRHRGGEIRLLTVTPRGRGLRDLTPGSALEATDATWSPSGRFLVFSATGEGIEGARIFTIAADGSDPRPLTNAPGRYDGAPSWSPDGRTIAFESYVGADPDAGPGTGIWTIAAPPARK